MRNKTYILILAVILPLIFAACGGVKKINTGMDGKPVEMDEFYESVRLIMLKSERQIYKHLPDEDSRRTFIEDFWKKRDPNPETESNENRKDYEKRMAYADRFFRERVGSGRGWESDRGKIFLLLGAPDTRNTERRAVTGALGTRKDALTELWVYDYYRLALRFVDSEGFGVYRLRYWPTNLLTAIDRAKFVVHQPENRSEPFSFKARYAGNKINIQVPVKTIGFEETGDNMNARFKIQVYVYHDYKKIDNLEKEHLFEDSKKSVLGRKRIAMNVPYTLDKKGRYYFDIIVEDVASTARYRDMVSVKH